MQNTSANRLAVAGIGDTIPNEMFILSLLAHNLVSETDVKANNHNVKETVM